MNLKKHHSGWEIVHLGPLWFNDTDHGHDVGRDGNRVLSSSNPRQNERQDEDDEGEGEGQREEEEQRKRERRRPQRHQDPGASAAMGLQRALLRLDAWPTDDQRSDL